MSCPLDNPPQARRADERIGQHPAGSAGQGADDGAFMCRRKTNSHAAITRSCSVRW